MIRNPPTESPGRNHAALERLARLEAPAGLHAVVLALLLVPRSKHTLDGWQAWQHETDDNPQAQALWNLVDSLPAAARLPCFELLLARMAGQPLALRQALLESTRRVMRSRGAVRPIDRLHWLAMRLLLGAPALFGAGSAAPPVDLSDLPDNRLRAVAGYSAYLSRMVPADAAGGGAAGAAWLAAVLAPWRERGLMAPGRPPDIDALVHALHELQALTAQQRPLLLDGWTGAALQQPQNPGGGLGELAADALRLSCRLLDCPLPAALAHHYSDAFRETA